MFSTEIYGLRLNAKLIEEIEVSDKVSKKNSRSEYDTSSQITH